MNGGRDGDLIRRIETLEKNQGELIEIKNMGRGALWMLFKIGLVVATVVGIVGAMWRFLHGGS